MGQLPDIGAAEAWPTLEHRVKALLVILLCSRFEVRSSVEAFLIFFRKIPEHRCPLDQTLTPFEFGPFLFLQVGQFELCDTQDFGLEALANKLAAHSDSGEILSRWRVTNQVCIRRFLPEQFAVVGRKRGTFAFHAYSIRFQYQIVKLESS